MRCVKEERQKLKKAVMVVKPGNFNIGYEPIGVN